MPDLSPHSLAQSTGLTCPRCGQAFQADLWLIVDAAERPDLLAQVEEGTLHALPCPHCGHQGQADALLLLYRPGEEPALIFSPAQATSQEQAQEQAQGLLGTLRQRLGDAWRDEWAAQVPAVPRPLLPLVLREGLEAAARQAQEASPLLQAVWAFLEAGTWAESRRVVEQHAELLDGEADALLGQLVQAAGAQGDERARRLFEEHHALLRRCREVGIEAAFAEHIGVQRAAGGDVSIPPEFEADLRQAQEGVQRYLRTGDRAALDEAATAWEHILGHAAFAAASERLQLAALNDGGGVFLRRYWARGRVDDLNRALECWQQAVQRTPADSPDLPGYLNNLGTGLSDRYARSGQLADLEEAIRVYQQAVQRTPPDSPDLPSLLTNLGTGLSDRYVRTGQLADLEETICTYERALTVLDRAFLLSPVAYQLGQQGRWAGLTARTVEVHHQAGRPAQALAIAEGSKSRLLTTLLGRRQIPTPATIPGDLAEREQTLVAALVDLDAADLARHGSDAAGDSTLPQRQALVAQLVSLWEEMEEGHRPEASDYVP